MEWKINRSKPICPQISDLICLHITKGNLKPGEKMISVREMAVAAGVNPNTVQKAFEELESKGTLYSVRGSGWYVAHNTKPAEEQMKKTISNKVGAFLSEMSALGYGREEVIGYLEDMKDE